MRIAGVALLALLLCGCRSDRYHLISERCWREPRGIDQMDRATAWAALQKASANVVPCMDRAGYDYRPHEGACTRGDDATKPMNPDCYHAKNWEQRFLDDHEPQPEHLL